MPTGKKDDYYLFSSGGQSGQVIVIGVPSMRILKYIAVFTPEPWQGYGFGDQGSEAVLAAGDRRGMQMRWGDTHHPNLSETNGDYDGAVPVHRRQGQRAAGGDQPHGLHHHADRREPAPRVGPRRGLRHAQHRVRDRGLAVSGVPSAAPTRRSRSTTRSTAARSRFWKFDRASGRIEPEQSFAIEVPPYMQDLADAGKLESDGWAFVNSFNTERAHGGNLEGQPPLESGASQNDMDYLHVVNWKKAEELFKAGKAEHDRRLPGDPAGDRRGGGRAQLRARAQEPARRRRDAGRQVHRRRRQARHARHRLRLREDQGADRGQGLRGQGPLRRPDPRLPEVDQGPGRARARPAAHASSTTRATPTRRCSSSRRSRSGRSPR